MADIKHVGRVKASGRKCLIVYRTIPGDAFSCLVVLTENLHPSYHDALINLVESNAAQTAIGEFADVLNRNIFSDGTNMLQSLHVQHMLTKIPTADIEMTPNSSTIISLAELNQLIAQANNCSVQDLAIKNDPKKNVEIQEVAKIQKVLDPVVDPIEAQQDAALLKQIEQPLSDEQLAKQYRSDADRLAKESANLRRMAEELVPSKKKKVATTE